MDNTKNGYIILGAGGHGAVIADILYKSGADFLGFLDDTLLVGTEILGSKVLGGFDSCTEYQNVLFLIGLGYNDQRKKIAEKYNIEYGIAIHPSAIIGHSVKISVGTVLMAGSIVNPRTTIGRHCIINTNASVDHDNTLGDFVHISPGAALAGHVKVGDNTHIGIGAAVRNEITISHNTTIGAGAAVVKDITIPGTYVGVPARKI